MADRADAYVKNGLTDNINVIRKLPDGSNDFEVTVKSAAEEMVPLLSPEVSLVINAPTGIDIKGYPVKIKSDVDLAVTCSRTHSNWAIKIIPNDLPPDSPTTLNVEVSPPGQ